jgi:hypothetical protein
MGVIEVDNMLMLLSTSNKMTEKERDTIMPLILQGFKVIECLLDRILQFLKFRFDRIVLKKQVQPSKVVKLSLIHG